MREFEAGDHTYRTDKLNVRDQLHLLRRLGPLVGPLIRLLLAEPEGDPADNAARQIALIGPFLDAFSQMPEGDVNYIVNQCLSVTKRRVGMNGSETWSNCLVGGRDQFNDIDLPSLMQIAREVIQDNLGGFFVTAAPPQTTTGEGAERLASLPA